MKKGFLLLLMACLGYAVSAQKVYFIYLQMEDQTPFYVRIGEKIFSSATTGFLILPNLVDTTYNLAVGFAKSSEAESKFSVPVYQNDRGFLLKRFNDGLALFDFESLEVLKANVATKDNTVYETKTDNFSTTLSKAAADPSLVRVAVTKTEEPPKIKTETQETVAKSEDTKQAPGQSVDKSIQTTLDSSVAVKNSGEDKLVKAEDKATLVAKQDSAVIEPTTKEAVVTQPPLGSREDSSIQAVTYQPSFVSRRSESSTTEGFGLVYLDKADGVTDTIRILIPPSKIKLVADDESHSDAVKVANAKEKIDSVVIVKKNAIDSVANVINDITKSDLPASCKNVASDKEFIKLRKKMASKDDDEGMIEEARKEFKLRCYRVEQVRYLSTLLLTPASKYQFFDSAYGHVADSSKFSSLATEIKDDYYSKRFKALIGE